MNWAHEYTDKQIERINKRLSKEYARADKEITKKINNHWKQYDKEAKKMMKGVESGKIPFDKYISWGEKKYMTGERWEELRKNIAEDLHAVNNNARGIIGQSVPKVFEENYNWNGYNAERRLGMSTSFSLYNKNALVKLASDKPNLFPKYLDKAKDVKWNERKISSQLMQGIIQGEDINKISKRISKVTGANKASSMRAARTYMTSAQNAGRLESISDLNRAGIETWKMWLTAGDDRVRRSHRDIDGESVPYNEYFSNGLMYPADPEGAPEEVWNCRCDILSDFVGFGNRFDVQDQSLRWFDFEEADYESWKAGKMALAGGEAMSTTSAALATERAIANAEEYSDSWHVEHNFEDNKSRLTEDEADSIHVYTSNTYRRMNGYMRDMKSFDEVGEDIVEHCRICTSGLDKTEIAEDTLLYRGLGSTRTFSRGLGISEDELAMSVKDGSIVGQRFSEKGFCSTGINGGAGWDKEVNLEIIAPKGTKGMYVDPISAYSGEQEMLLQQGTVFEVLGVEEKWGTYNVRCVIVEQKPVVKW